MMYISGRLIGLAFVFNLLIASAQPQVPHSVDSSCLSSPSNLQGGSISVVSADPQGSLFRRDTKPKKPKAPRCLSAGAVAGGTVGGFALGIILGGAIAWFVGLSRGQKKGLAEAERKLAHSSADGANEHEQSEPTHGMADTGSRWQNFSSSRSQRSEPMPEVAELGSTSPVPVGKMDPRETVGEGHDTVAHPL